MTNKIIKVVLCGPPHSGKSCMRYGLKEAIKTIENAHYPYVITACPDGEGSWFQETGSQNPDLAATLKASNKGNFTKEQINIWSDSIKNCIEPLTLVDIGGIPDALNEQICAYATHAILLAGNCDHLPEWRAFCEKLNLQIIAELYSDYKGTEDKNLILGNDNILKISFGDPAQNDQIVKDAAKRLDDMIKAGQLSGGELMRINGPASLPVAMVIAHSLSHLYQALACYDPKLAKYVVAIAHGDKYRVGDLIE